MNTIVKDRTASRFTDFDVDPPAPRQLPAVAEQQSYTQAPSTALEPATSVFPVTSVANIATAISGVMSQITPVAKGGRNTFHNYKYARMEDLLQELTPLIAEHGLMIVQTEVGRAMFDDDKAISIQYRFTIAHKSGEVWPEHPIQTGLASCRHRNGSFDDKALNKCHTAARKYFLLGLFQVPTEDMDDADKHRSASRDEAPPPSTAKPHKLSTQNATFGKWKDSFLRFIERAETEEEVIQWENLNDEALNKLNEHNHGVYDEITKAVRRKLSTFGRTPGQQETETWGEIEGQGESTANDANDDEDPPAPSKPTLGSLATTLIGEIDKLITFDGCLDWANRSTPRIKLLSEQERGAVNAKLMAKQNSVKGAERKHRD